MESWEIAQQRALRRHWNQPVSKESSDNILAQLPEGVRKALRVTHFHPTSDSSQFHCGYAVVLRSDAGQVYTTTVGLNFQFSEEFIVHLCAVV